MPLHIDYRPKSFDEIVGNESIINSLNSILSREDKPHTYMFTGPRGCGKTTFARILAKELGANELEIHEYDTSNVRGIEEIQKIKQQSLYAPLSGGIRINVWDEAHEITKKGAEALLKFLEDTPDHVYNILCTTNPEKIPETVRRRCSYYTVQSLISRDMKKILTWVLESEGLSIQEDVAKKLISASKGCPGIMLVKLDQIVDIKGNENQLNAIEEVTDSNAKIIDICQRIMAKEGSSIKWKGLSDILLRFEEDPEQTRRAILGYLTKVLLGCNADARGEKIVEIMAEFMNHYYETGKSGLVSSCFLACLK